MVVTISRIGKSLSATLRRLTSSPASRSDAVGSRGRDRVFEPGAEGATAPETLRQKDRAELGTHAGKRVVAAMAKARAEGARDGEAARNLSGPRDSGGVGDVRGIAPRARRAVEFFDRSMDSADTLKTTPLIEAHVAVGGKMVSFGGYSMPVQYPLGILKEHLWTREHAGLFDVSHMGPSFLQLTSPTGDFEADHRAVAALIEPLVCGDIRGLKPGQIRYTLLLNASGGMVDDLMIGRPAETENQGRLYIVVNAGTKDGDFAAIAAAAGSQASLTRADDGALLALQGPEAAAVMADLMPAAADLSFMTFTRAPFEGADLVIARSGYTGEDGYEILSPAAVAGALWDRLTADARVEPIGLGARDSLRLEAGLPLYGHDADGTVSPIEAALAFAVSKRRLKAQDFPGAARVAGEVANAPSRVRVGLRVTGAPAREGAVIADENRRPIGVVTSGGFSPSLGAPIAMGFVPPAFAIPGTVLTVIVRDRPQAAEVVAMPFVPHRYFRKTLV
jgi:aminomethyltransferase